MDATASRSAPDAAPFDAVDVATGYRILRSELGVTGPLSSSEERAVHQVTQLWALRTPEHADYGAVYVECEILLRAGQPLAIPRGERLRLAIQWRRHVRRMPTWAQNVLAQAVITVASGRSGAEHLVRGAIAIEAIHTRYVAADETTLARCVLAARDLWEERLEEDLAWCASDSLARRMVGDGVDGTRAMRDQFAAMATATRRPAAGRRWTAHGGRRRRGTSRAGSGSSTSGSDPGDPDPAGPIALVARGGWR